MTREEIIFFFRNFKIEVNGKVITFSIEEIKKMNLAPFLEKSNFSQEIIKERFKTNIEKLKIDPEIWKNCCLKKPRLFLHLPETINNKIQDLYLLLGIKRETLLEMIIKKPSILLFKPEKITYNVEAISKILGIAKDDFIVSAIKKPNLLTYSVKSASKIAVIAEMLKVEKQMVVKASMNNPTLFSLKTNKIEVKYRLFCLLSNEGTGNIAKKLLASPDYFNLSETNVLEKYGLALYIGKNFSCRFAREKWEKLVQKNCSFGEAQEIEKIRQRFRESIANKNINQDWLFITRCVQKHFSHAA